MDLESREILLMPLLEECSDQPQIHQKVEGILLYMDSKEILLRFQGSPGSEPASSLMILQQKVAKTEPLKANLGKTKSPLHSKSLSSFLVFMKNDSSIVFSSMCVDAC